LGDSTRLQLVEHLRHKDTCVCDLVSALHLGQSLVSFHLKVLKEAGLITDRRAGRWVYYSVVPDALAELEGLFESDPDATRTSNSSRDRT
jgi:ArsR family transcriptional regulator